MHFTLDQRNLDSKIIEMYLRNHLGKSVCNKRFIRTLKTKIYKYMTSISKQCVH